MPPIGSEVENIVPATAPETKPENTAQEIIENEKPLSEKKNNELTDSDFKDLTDEEVRDRLYGKKKDPESASEKPEKKDEKKPEGADDDLDTSDPEKVKLTYRQIKAEKAALEAEVAKRLKREKDQEEFINRQGNDIGKLNQVKKAFESMLADPAKAIEYLKSQIKPNAENQGEDQTDDDETFDSADLMEGKPEGLIKILNNPKVKNNLLTTLKTEIAKEQTEALEVENTVRAKREEKKMAIKAMIPEFEEIEEDIYTVMKEDDKLPDAVIEHFKSKKYEYDHQKKDTVIPADVLYHYSKRALDKKLIRELKSKIAKLEGAPSDILDQIDRAAKGQGMSNASAQGPSTSTKTGSEVNGLTPEKIREMPDDEIAKRLEKFRNRK